MNNREIVSGFFINGYTLQNYDWIMEYVAEDYLDHSPAGARSNTDVVGILKAVSRQFSGLTAEIADIFTDGAKVAVRVVFEGIHSGECMGIAPSGKKIRFEALEYFRIEHGKIAESWGYWPDKEIERQLLAQKGSQKNEL